MTRPALTIRAATSRVLVALVPAATLWSCGEANERATATAEVAEQAGNIEATAAGGTNAAIETASRAPRDSALIAYIANEGVMLVAAGKTVLIDALFRDGVSGYETVSSSMREAVERGIGAFSGVELVLASHHHADHFDAAAVLRHLRNNPVARFVSTRQTAALLDAASSDPAEDPAGSSAGGAEPTAVLERVVGVWPDEGRDTVLSFDDIDVRILRLHHGRDFDPPVQNLGLLVNSGGFKALHVGDTEAGVEDFATYRLADEGIHLALLPYWKLLEDEGARLVREIGAERVVAIHVPAPGAPTSWFGRTGSREALVAELQRTAPGVIVLDEPGETHQIGYWRGDRPRDGSP
jgi:L-ascorbate metabolism protein UlaG (beta-lactamase superfamily)